MKAIVILLLRFALGLAFLSAVADRFGLWGPPGSAIVAWGNMENFLGYTSTVTFGATGILLKILGWTATILEAVLGIFLIIGFKMKSTAILSGLLLLLFGIGMVCNLPAKTVLDFSVFSACFGAFLLAFQPRIKFSVDYFL
ncbi:MAG TPA: DoxX family protein [Flavobacteriaceae bacterium]|nr:DoxX family protein [Flavobacteriaceae bacterium]